MNVTLIGMGSGQPENLTLQGLAALRQADLILGARRLLAVLPAGCTENRAAAYRPDEVAELLQTSGAENAVLVYSGDTGFYSGASSMMEKLEALGVRARVLPGLSSIQLLAAALGRPWQGWNLVSAHGRTCDPVAECMQGRPTFFLTGGSEDPATLCAQLEAEGFGDMQAVVGQCLGTPEEKLFRGSVKELAAGRFNSLSVLLVEAVEGLPRRAPGLPDEAFERGDVPMTKQEVRAAVLAKLAVRPEDILWDVGAGRAASAWSWHWPRPGAGCTRWSAGRGLCAHQSQPRKIQDPESRPRGGACPRRPFGPARAGRCLHRRQQGQPCRHRGRRAG